MQIIRSYRSDLVTITALVVVGLLNNSLEKKPGPGESIHHSKLNLDIVLYSLAPFELIKIISMNGQHFITVVLYSLTLFS